MGGHTPSFKQAGGGEDESPCADADEALCPWGKMLHQPLQLLISSTRPRALSANHDQRVERFQAE
jgi:hypothetical protein